MSKAATIKKRTITRNLSLGEKHSAMLDKAAMRLNTTPSHAARIAIGLLSKQSLTSITG